MAEGRAVVPPQTWQFRYVLHERVGEFLRLGWMVEADLGPYHGVHLVLMSHCECGAVMP